MKKIIEEFTNILNIVIEKFNEKEEYLIVNDVDERTIVSKFSRYLEEEIRNNQILKIYDIDQEWNRGYEGKDSNVKINPLTAKRMRVDLIVHQRGYKDKPSIDANGRQYYGYNNIACFEFKKESNWKQAKDDKERLKELVDPKGVFRYLLGFMIKICKLDKKIIIDEQF